MNENLIVFEKFPGVKNNSFVEKHSKIIFIVLISILLILLFFISSVANKMLLDSYDLTYHEKI